MSKKKIRSYVAYRCSQQNMDEISCQYIDSEIDVGNRSNGFLQMSGRRDGSMVNTRKPLEMSAIAIAVLVILILVQVAAAEKPNTPTLYTPSDSSEITTLTPTFIWSPFSDPDGDHQSLFNIVVWEEPGPDTKGTVTVLDYYYSTPNSSVTPNLKDYKKGLENGKWYHWHVRVMDNNGDWSNYANDTEYSYMDFRITPLNPLNVSLITETDSIGTGQTSTIIVNVRGNSTNISEASVMLDSTPAGRINPSSGTTDRFGQFVSTFTALDVGEITIRAIVRKENFTNGFKEIRIVVYPSTIRTDIYVEPHTGQIINRLELSIQDLNTQLLNINTSIKPTNIKLNYVLEGTTRNDTFYLVNDSYYIGKTIKVDLNNRGDYPFEEYNTTLFISSDDLNFSNANFTMNSTNKSLSIDSWGQARVVNFAFGGNKIEILMTRADKEVSERLYYLGVTIIVLYLSSFVIIYIILKIPYNADMFAFFNTFSFLFFVGLTIAGIREYLFISIWGNLFIFLIFASLVIFVITRITSKK